MAASPSQHGRQASRTRNSRLNFSCNSYFWSWISPQILLTIPNPSFTILNSTTRRIMILVIMLQHKRVILLSFRMIQTQLIAHLDDLSMYLHMYHWLSASFQQRDGHRNVLKGIFKKKNGNSKQQTYTEDSINAGVVAAI